MSYTKNQDKTKGNKPKVNKEALEQSIKDKQKVINGKKIVRK